MSLLIFSTVAFYRIAIHPLSKYPGPKLWCISWIPYAYYTIRGFLPHKIAEFHKKFGPVIRIAPSQLSYITEDAWSDIYGKKHGVKPLQKDPKFV